MCATTCFMSGVMLSRMCWVLTKPKIIVTQRQSASGGKIPKDIMEFLCWICRRRDDPEREPIAGAF